MYLRSTVPSMNVLPAYAGMIHLADDFLWSVSGAPRVCGDDPQTVHMGASLRGVLPAYAGMIPVTGDTLNTVDGCSPRMRG